MKFRLTSGEVYTIVYMACIVLCAAALTVYGGEPIFKPTGRYALPDVKLEEPPPPVEVPIRTEHSSPQPVESPAPEKPQITTDKLEQAADHAMVPVGPEWWEESTGKTSVQHVISHGCPPWVAQLYANNPTMLNKIHGGYHEIQNGSKNYTMMRVDRVKAAAPAKVAQPAQQPVYSSNCPNGRCPLQQGGRKARKGLFSWR